MPAPLVERPIGGHVWRALLIATSLAVPAGRAFAGPAAPPSSAAGMTIHRDPETGLLTAPPPGAAALPRASARPTAMTERVGLSPAGGILLDGIPRMGVAVEVGPAGAAVTHCDREPVRGGE